MNPNPKPKAKEKPKPLDINSLVKDIEMVRGEKGWLAEIFRADREGQFKQIYIYNVSVGAWRGNHYHKKRKEWVFVITGELIFTLWEKDKRAEAQSITLGAAKPQVLEIPAGLFHKVENQAFVEGTVVSACSDLYDKENPDTFEE